jgi:quercetin dioxygenase-like cupin family protein
MMNLSEFEAELQAGHYSAAVTVRREIGYQMAEHSHSFDAFALITLGEITLVVDGVSTCYAVGDVFGLPAGTVHSEGAGTHGVTYLSGRRESSAA